MNKPNLKALKEIAFKYFAINFTIALALFTFDLVWIPFILPIIIVFNVSSACYDRLPIITILFSIFMIPALSIYNPHPITTLIYLCITWGLTIYSIIRRFQKS